MAENNLGVRLAAAIENLAENKDGLDNLMFYVTRHGEKWFSTFCKDLEELISELNAFASM